MNDDQTPQNNNDDIGEDPSPLAYNVAINGERRSGFDRRHFSYKSHVPERRSGQERRSKPYPPPQEAA